MEAIHITLSYGGRQAEQNAIGFYDVAQALIGFERSLALTTHLILNNEIITQAPALRGAQIIARPPSEGSWELTAIILVGAATVAYKLGTAPKDTPIGHLVRSAYDYIVSELLGVHVDFDKTLGQSIEDARKKDDSIRPLSQSRFDSLMEKCEVAVKDMHRPIVKSATARYAKLTAKVGDADYPFDVTLTQETYDYIEFTERAPTPSPFAGSVTSYNMNTFKGRIFIPEHGRPIPFQLSDLARDSQSVVAVGASLNENIQTRINGDTGGGEVRFLAFENLSRTGRLKSLLIVEILGPIRS